MVIPFDFHLTLSLLPRQHASKAMVPLDVIPLLVQAYGNLRRRRHHHRPWNRSEIPSQVRQCRNDVSCRDSYHTRRTLKTYYSDLQAGAGAFCAEAAESHRTNLARPWHREAYQREGPCEGY